MPMPRQVWRTSGRKPPARAPRGLRAISRRCPASTSPHLPRPRRRPERAASRKSRAAAGRTGRLQSAMVPPDCCPTSLREPCTACIPGRPDRIDGRGIRKPSSSAMPMSSGGRADAWRNGQRARGRCSARAWRHARAWRGADGMPSAERSWRSGFSSPGAQAEGTDDGAARSLRWTPWRKRRAIRAAETCGGSHRPEGLSRGSPCDHRAADPGEPLAMAPDLSPARHPAAQTEAPEAH